MTCPSCGGSGLCSSCSGTGKQTCYTCNGQGLISELCIVCHGSGSVDGAPCPNCGGTGQIRVTCPLCNGAGNVTCGVCAGSGICQTCHGSGQIPDNASSVKEKISAKQQAVIADLYGFAVEKVLKPGASGQGQPFDGYAFISNRLVTDIQSISFGVASVAMTPVTIASSSYKNGTSAAASQTFTDSKTTTATASVQVTNGVTTGVNNTFSLNYLIGGTSLTLSVSTNFSVVQSNGSSVAQTWSWLAIVPVPAHSTVEASVVVQTGNYAIPFTAKVRLSGDFYWTRDVGQGSPNEYVYNVGWNVGGMFQTFPYPGVTVIDANTVECDVSGIWNAVEGLDYQVVATQVDASGKIIATEEIPPRKRSTLYGKPGKK
jgi:hypothetical protein